MQELPRRLGLFSAVAILVGNTIGSGIFRSPAGIASTVPDVSLFFAVWIAGGICVLAGALTYAELAAALPRTGGTFVYLREGFGRLPAFLYGWAELIILRPSALGAISTVFAEYLFRLLGSGGSEFVRYGAVGAILIVAVFNFRGVQIGALVQNLTATTKFAALVVLVVASFAIGGSASTPVSAPAASGSISISLFGLALISVLWVYDGWADLTYVSGEVRRPGRNLPLALMIGTAAIIAVYLAANFAYMHVMGIARIADSQLVGADVAEQLVGNAGLTLISLAVMISTFGALNGSMMTGPRIFFAMADEGLFFKKIASVHPRFKTPHLAISLAAVMASAFVMVRSFEQLADTFVLGIWPFYAGGVAAVYALRRKQPNLERPYRVWGYPFTPAVFIAAALFLLTNALLEGTALIVFGILLMGVPVYFIWGRYNNIESMRGR